MKVIRPPSTSNKTSFMLKAIKSYVKTYGIEDTKQTISNYLEKLEDPYEQRKYYTD